MTTPDSPATYSGLTRALVAKGLLTEEQADTALHAYQQPGQRLSVSDYLVKESLVDQAVLLGVLGDLYHIPVSQIQDEMVDPEAVSMVPVRMALRYNLLPLRIQNDALLVATADPLNIQAFDDLRAHTRRRIDLVLADPSDLRDAIKIHFRDISAIEQEIDRMSSPETDRETAEDQALMESVNQAPIVRTLDSLIFQAVRDRASDIHIQPQPTHTSVRYRIDGILQQVLSLPLSTHRSIIARLKVMAQLNPTEHRFPQDGQFAVDVDGQTIDVRLATAASSYGEMAGLRILSRSNSLLSLTELGFSQNTLEATRRLLRFPHGMILIAGPTGAGKTTTLYASLGELDKVHQNIITIEDPVEYRFEGITQLPVSARYGISFASGLRAIMRLDPDVILVGEIRDAETAQIAIQAALTGHLVMSSIHANDAVGAIFRLLNLGADRFMVSAALLGIIAQRMVRKVCRRCAREEDCSIEEIPIYQQVMREPRRRFDYGQGCQFCARSGFFGRTGIFEMLETSEELQDMILRSASAGEVRRYCIDAGMSVMLQDGMEKARQGVTTPAEVIRHAFTISSSTNSVTGSAGRWSE